MRKIFSTMMLVAAAAMTFVSCQKEDQNAPQPEQGYITFSSTNPETKTEHNGTTIVWSTGDKIRIACQTAADTWYTSGSDVQAKLYVSDALAEGGESAQFKVKTGGDYYPTGLTGTLQFYALYPSEAEDASFSPSTSCASIKIEDQTTSSSTYDSSYDILWGKATTTYSSIPTEESVPIMWNRVVAHACISLNSIKGIAEGEEINTITLTVDEDAALAGTFNLNMATGEFTSKSAVNTLTFTCEDVVADAEGNVAFWACINPCTITSIDIEVDTDVATYTYSRSGFEREFVKNMRNVLPVNMSGATRTEKVVEETDAYYVKVTTTPDDWSGTYLLVAEKSGSFYVFNQTIESDWGKLTSVDVADNQISSVAASGYEMTIESGSSSGTYALKIKSGKYLSASAKNKINTIDSKGTNTDMNITLQSDGTVVISLSSKSERTLQCNVSASYGFRFYDSGSQVNPQLYKLQSN